MALTRRHFIQWILGAPVLSCLPFHVHEAGGSSIPVRAPIMGGRTPIGQYFNGEELVYEAGFWMIRRAAMGTLSFKSSEKKGYCTATFQGETMGVLGWVARYRVDTYRAVMEEINQGMGLRSVSFEEHVKIGKKINRRIHLFDYQRRRWTSKRLRKDGTWQVKEVEIPPGMVYDDFITAFYNFRYGVYGPVERGRKYVVATFPRKGFSNYEVVIAPEEEEDRMRRAGRSGPGKDFLIRLKLDPETTYSKDGLIEGWLSKDLYPMEGEIKDVNVIGDVRGTLIKKGKV